MKYIVSAISLFIVLLSFAQEVKRPQEKTPFSIYGGIGFPEIAHIGPRIQFGQIRFGAYFGGWKNKLSTGGDFYLHFGKTSDFSQLKQGYFRIGYNFQAVHEDYSTFEYSHVVIRIGRDLYEDEHVGFSIDLGATMRVYQIEYNKNYPPPPPPSLDGFTISLDYFNNTFLYPSISATLFYRI
jgi:hypothetical protein